MVADYVSSSVSELVVRTSDGQIVTSSKERIQQVTRRRQMRKAVVAGAAVGSTTLASITLVVPDYSQPAAALVVGGMRRPGRPGRARRPAPAWVFGGMRRPGRPGRTRSPHPGARLERLQGTHGSSGEIAGRSDCRSGLLSAFEQTPRHRTRNTNQGIPLALLLRDRTEEQQFGSRTPSRCMDLPVLDHGLIPGHSQLYRRFQPGAPPSSSSAAVASVGIRILGGSVRTRRLE